MSSHHIVKEKQEPALLIANGEACDSVITQSLLEWSPTVIVLDGAIDRVVASGIKVDILIGDFDSGEEHLEEIQESQFPIKIVHTPDQEKTDLEKGIEYLISQGYPAVNIIWATGKRMDHTLANVTNIIKYQEKIKIVMLDDYSRITPLLPLPHKFEKWLPAKTVISLIPISTAFGVITHNLKYPLSDENLSLAGRIGNSNEVAEEGLIQIQFREGNLLLLECHD
jgi:thiamine pyrophosphokinase